MESSHSSSQAMSLQQTEWKIARNRGACARCNRAFDQGEEHRTALYELEAPPAEVDARSKPKAQAEDELLLERLDYCDACWDPEAAARAGAEDGTPLGSLLAWWRTAFDPPRSDKPVFDRDTAIELFRGLSDTEDDRRLRFRYVLALMLMRKRVLKYRDVLRRDEQEWMVVTQRTEDGDIEHRVLDPGLTVEDSASLSEEIARVMEW